MPGRSRVARQEFSIKAGVAAGLFALLASCGGGGTTPTAVATPTPVPAPAAEIVSQGNAPLCPGCGHWLYFSLRTSGAVTVTVDYTYSDTPMALWLGPGRSTYEMCVAQQCSWTATSFTGAKPRVFTLSLTPGEYTFVIDNRGIRDEAASWQVVLRPQSASTGPQVNDAQRDSTPSERPGPRFPSPPRPDVQ